MGNLGRGQDQPTIAAGLCQGGECDRGGDVTFHGPGQLVGYPIFDLRGYATPEGNRKTLGAIDYVRRLEEVLVRTCSDFSIPAFQLRRASPDYLAISIGSFPVAAGVVRLDSRKTIRVCVE